MDPALIGWIIKLVSGAIGGNVAGAVMKDKSFGVAGNSVAGILGGGLGGFVMQMFQVAQAGGLDIGSVIGSVASGGIGGAVLMVIGALIKGMMAGKA